MLVLFFGNSIYLKVLPSLLKKESYRTLIEGGKIRIWYPDFMSFNATEDPTHIHVFNISTLRKILKDLGFNDLRHYTNVGDRLPKPLRRAIQGISLLLCDELYVEVGKQ